MRTDLQALGSDTVDLLVIGAGIQGAALAREAALRGCSVVLVERTDFGSGTSSKSSRLVHGGLRYLEHGHLSLVREALHERERLLRLAPHLVRPQPMLMPFFKGGPVSPLKVRFGLWLYDVLAGRHSMPRAKSYRPDDCRRLFPRLRARDLRGGALFYDARTEDLRLVLANVEAAAAAGARVVNHTALVGCAGDRVELRDELTGDVAALRAGRIVNAAGPSVDLVRRLLGVDAPDVVRLSRGSHIVLDPLEGEVALAAALPDHRIQFVIPHPDGTLCGTTEVETPPQTEIEVDLPVPEADLEYLLEALRYLWEDPPDRADVRFAYAGWRTLPAVQGPAGRLNREAFLHPETCAAGALHTVVGGKLTTHRSFAERALNGLLGVSGPSPTRSLALPGGDGPQEFGDPLWWRHGSRAREVRELARPRPDLLEPMCPHRDLLRAEAVFALRHQGVRTFADLMQRRLFHSMGPCLQPGCLAAAHDLFAEYAPVGATPDRDADVAALVAGVRYALGALRAPG